MTRLAESPRRWWALGALVLAMLVVGLDGTVVSVALPTLSTAVGATNSQLQWMSDAYIVVLAVALLPAGLLGDRYGRKRVLLTGLLLFGFASLAGTLVQSADALIAVRAVMGLGGAAIMPLTMSILPSMFDRAELPRAVGVWAASSALGIPLGPIIGGWLLQTFWWGSIFFLNVPTVAAAFAAAVWLLPESRDPRARRFDPLGLLLGVVGLAALVFGVIEGPQWGWADARVLAGLVGGLAFLVALVAWENRADEPMMDLGLFHDRNFLWGSIAATFASFALFGGLFVLPQYLQAVLGEDPVGTGVRLLPMMAGLLVAARGSDRVVTRVGARFVVGGGLLLAAAGLLLGATTGMRDGYGFTAVWLVVLGLGTGFTLIPAMGALMVTLPRDRAGMGSALVQTLRQCGSALSVALLGSALAARYTARLHLHGLTSGVAHAVRDSVGSGVAVASRLHDRGLLLDTRQAFVHGMDLVLLICGVLAVPTALAVMLWLTGRNGEAAADGAAAPAAGQVVAPPDARSKPVDTPAET